MGSKYSKALLLGALAALPSGVAITWIYFWPDANLMEPQGFYFGRDFLNYWTGGRLALTGPVEVAYDVERYNALLREWFSPEQSGMAFSYPPHALPLLAPFGALPYLTAYALWCLVGAVGFAAICLGRAPTREDASLVTAIALAPIVWVNVIFGQMGLLLALLFVGALRILPARPVLAGALMGVLTIKPQLGLLRRWCCCSQAPGGRLPPRRRRRWRSPLRASCCSAWSHGASTWRRPCHCSGSSSRKWTASTPTR